MEESRWETAVPNWESLWARYDDLTYQIVLSFLWNEDIVLDIGAGDLYLTRQMAQQTRRVYAIERQPGLLTNDNRNIPANMQVICADARFVTFPKGVTVAVLLMRHCAHFSLYLEKLKAIGCRRLITNARWGMGVEQMDLLTPPQPFATLSEGWYACLCGETGYVPGSADQLTLETADGITEVTNCPACSPVTTQQDWPHILG